MQELCVYHSSLVLQSVNNLLVNKFYHVLYSSHNRFSVNYTGKLTEEEKKIVKMVYVAYFYLLITILGVTVSSAPAPQFNNDETSLLRFYNENNGSGQYNYL